MGKRKASEISADIEPELGMDDVSGQSDAESAGSARSKGSRKKVAGKKRRSPAKKAAPKRSAQAGRSNSAEAVCPSWPFQAPRWFWHALVQRLRMVSPAVKLADLPGLAL